MFPFKVSSDVHTGWIHGRGWPSTHDPALRKSCSRKSHQIGRQISCGAIYRSITKIYASNCKYLKDFFLQISLTCEHGIPWTVSVRILIKSAKKLFYNKICSIHENFFVEIDWEPVIHNIFFRENWKFLILQLSNISFAKISICFSYLV